MSSRALNVLIVEDEYPARLRLQKMLEQYSWINLVGSADSGKKAVKLIGELKPDLIFLDIHLPDFNGFDVLKAIDYNPMVIFATAYEEYAIKAFEAHSIDYMVKPLTKERLDKALKKMQSFSNGIKSAFNVKDIDMLSEQLMIKKKVSMLAVRIGSKMKLIDISDIVYIKAEDKYSMVYESNSRKYFCDKSLQELDFMLPDSCIRVHRSFIVNKGHITSVERIIKGRWLLTMGDGASTSIRTSDSYKDVFKSEMNL